MLKACYSQANPLLIPCLTGDHRRGAQPRRGGEPIALLRNDAHPASLRGALH